MLDSFSQAMFITRSSSGLVADRSSVIAVRRHDAKRPSWRKLIASALALPAVLSTSTVAGVPMASADEGWGDVQPLASTHAKEQSCAQILFVGTRGSGEQAPYGDTITSLLQEISSRTAKARPDLELAQVFLDYPAPSVRNLNIDDVSDMVLPSSSDKTTPAFLDSVQKGGAELERLATAEAIRCPDEKLLVAGYSQGAEVVTRGLSSGNLTHNLLAALLLANPLHYDGQNVNELDGTAGNRSFGLSTGLYYLRNNTASFANRSKSEQITELLKSLFTLSTGAVDNHKLTEAMEAQQVAIPGEDAPISYSVCTKDDLVCDAASALDRIATFQESVQHEVDEGGAIHGSYTPDKYPQTLAAIDAQIASLPHVDHSQTPTHGHVQFLPIFIAAGSGLLIATVAFLGYRVHRARRRTEPAEV